MAMARDLPDVKCAPQAPASSAHAHRGDDAVITLFRAPPLGSTPRDGRVRSSSSSSSRVLLCRDCIQ
eukprot:1909582-Pyramimonas_sp.AAC.1